MFTGLEPLLGLMCGAISMGGGHGTSATFGPTLESMGVVGANTIGLAAATLGLICGGLIGAPTSKYLITKYKLKPKKKLLLIFMMIFQIKMEYIVMLQIQTLHYQLPLQ